MITHKQLLTFALISTLAPQTTQPSALMGTITDFAEEHPHLVIGTTVTLVGLGAFMGGRASRNLELSTEKEQVTALTGQLTQQTNEAKQLLQQAQGERDQALKAANSFQDNLGKLFQAAKPNDVIPQNLTIDTLYGIIRGECRNLTITLEQLRETHAGCDEEKKQLEKQRYQDLQAIMKELDEKEAHSEHLSVETIISLIQKHTSTAATIQKSLGEVEQLKLQIAQTKQELSRRIATSEENFDLQKKLATSREKTIRLLEAKTTELEELIRQKDICIKLTQIANTNLCNERNEAYQALLKDTAPGNYAPQNKQNWFTERGFTPTQQTALNSVIACMQVVASTTNPISGETTGSKLVFHDQPHKMRLSTRTVPATADDIFKPAASTTHASAASATPKFGRKQWNKPTTPVHFDTDTTSSDAVTASAAAEHNSDGECNCINCLHFLADQRIAQNDAYKKQDDNDVDPGYVLWNSDCEGEDNTDGKHDPSTTC